ncbi:MAG TPA: 16S rRNA (uracil(1498)-N(3))-methyltransferase [Bacteroidales bacterium]|jgi:16S rRNA (uracil1498-N3)-methyltransferase|nr:16S rRNA (uracil(1498)-N(3))-methyltransferase [Bacteroidales bacterium]
MQWFYSESKELNGNITLSYSESHHCTRVLRMQNGNNLVCTDGKGNYYECEIIDINPRSTVLKVLKHEKDFGKRPYTLHIAIAPTKNNVRMEWFLEKSTEIGITEVTPILCTHSERKVIKPDRFRRVIESAMKQSQQTYLPKLNEMISFEQFVNNNISGKKYIAYCEEIPAIHLNKTLCTDSEILVMIGPEGDFSKEEVKLATENGFIPVGLGNTRLRTETAGIVASALVANSFV